MGLRLPNEAARGEEQGADDTCVPGEERQPQGSTLLQHAR